MDRMRESVFAVLGDLSGRSFLDLFSGSGIIALEAASRGASYIEAVESDRQKRGVLLANAALSPVRITCRFMAVEMYVRRSKRPFDVIFCDPPFSYRYKPQLLLSIDASPLTGQNSLVLIHRPRREGREGLELLGAGGLRLRESRYYGTSAVDFLQRG
jgi:16S rRNA (guanine(966)-N(2))-methyltransferase RsmD